MDFRILGPLEVLDDGRTLDLGGAKQRAALAVLALHANRVVAHERLIEALWDEEPPETARKALQVYVSQLRKVLGRDHLETKPRGYLLRLGPEELDLSRFELLRTAGSRSRRSSSGEETRWPTSPTGASPSPRSPGWRSFASPVSNSGSSATSPTDDTGS